MSADRATPVRITLIDPVVRDERMPVSVDAARIEIDHVGLRFGTHTIESRWGDALAVPGVLDVAIRAERAGAEVIVINGMDDPGVLAAREVVRIPVVGTAETALHLAVLLGGRATLVTMAQRDVPAVREIVAEFGLDADRVDVRALCRDVAELEDERVATLDAYARAVIDAVASGAAVVVPGCTLLADLGAELQVRLRAERIDIPVIDPVQAALEHARTLVLSGLRHSGRAYPAPPAKSILWPDPDAELGPRAEVA